MLWRDRDSGNIAGRKAYQNLVAVKLLKVLESEPRTDIELSSGEPVPLGDTGFEDVIVIGLDVIELEDVVEGVVEGVVEDVIEDVIEDAMVVLRIDVDGGVAVIGTVPLGNLSERG